MPRRVRKLIGMVAILLFLFFYALIVMRFAVSACVKPVCCVRESCP